MADFWFVVRTFLVTVVLFLGLQIRVGSRTIEQHSVAWVHSSSFIESLQDVSDGAVHVVHVATHKMTAVFTHLPAVGSADAQGTHDAKRRATKRIEVRKQMTREAVAEKAETTTATRAASAQVREPAAAATENAKTEERKSGSFRSFFDVKSVHDVDSQ